MLSMIIAITVLLAGAILLLALRRHAVRDIAISAREEHGDGNDHREHGTRLSAGDQPKSHIGVAEQ